MSMFLIAFTLAMQAPAADARPLPVDRLPPRDASPAHDMFGNQLRSSRPEARVAMQGYGRCVADRSPAEAAAALRMDFRTRAYGNRMQRLSATNRSCFANGTMRSSGLLFAGALAEHLVEREATPLNVRLARAAADAAPSPRAPSDRIAICTVRSVPDDVARLFATEVASSEETSVIESMGRALEGCAAGGPQLQSNPAGIRAVLATATFRTLEIGRPEASQ